MKHYKLCNHNSPTPSVVDGGHACWACWIVSLDVKHIIAQPLRVGTTCRWQGNHDCPCRATYDGKKVGNKFLNVNEQRGTKRDGEIWNCPPPSFLSAQPWGDPSSSPARSTNKKKAAPSAAQWHIILGWVVLLSHSHLRTKEEALHALFFISRS